MKGFREALPGCPCGLTVSGLEYEMSVVEKMG